MALPRSRGWDDAFHSLPAAARARRPSRARPPAAAQTPNLFASRHIWLHSCASKQQDTATPCYHHHYRSHRLLLEVVPSTHISDRILYPSLCSTWGVEWVSEQLANLACIMWVETGGFNWVPDPHTQIRNLRVRGCILLAPMGVRPCLMMLLIRGPTTEEKPTTDFTGQTIVPEIACAGILNYSYVKGVKIQKTTDLCAGSRPNSTYLRKI